MNKLVKKIIMVAMIGLILSTYGLITANADEIETDNKTGLATPKSIWNNYISNTKDIVENDSELNNWMDNFDTPSDLEKFLEKSKNNTEEEWKTFSKFEKFNYSIFNVKCKSKLYNLSFKDEDDFLDEYSYIKTWAINSCKTSTSVEPFFDEVEKVLRWQYQYFEKTNTIYDFFSDSQEQEVVTENLEEESEYQDIKNGLSSEYEKEEKVKKSEGFSIGRLLKNNILTMIIMGIIVIGLIVIFIKKKNSDE